MMMWKLTQNLSPALDHEWEKLVKSSLGEGIHEGRRRGFILARSALSECLQEAGLNPSIPDLRLKDYSSLESYPGYTISLSHTYECGAAVLADRKKFLSVGVDVERHDRVVKESIRGRISHPADHDLRNIELWCAKEAAFKALMNTGLFPVPVEFSSIQILKSYWNHPPSKTTGEWFLKTEGPFTIAIAYLRN